MDPGKEMGRGGALLLPVPRNASQLVGALVRKPAPLCEPPHEAPVPRHP